MFSCKTPITSCLVSDSRIQSYIFPLPTVLCPFTRQTQRNSQNRFRARCVAKTHCGTASLWFRLVLRGKIAHINCANCINHNLCHVKMRNSSHEHQHKLVWVKLGKYFTSVLSNVNYFPTFCMWFPWFHEHTIRLAINMMGDKLLLHFQIWTPFWQYRKSCHGNIVISHVKLYINAEFCAKSKE